MGRYLCLEPVLPVAMRFHESRSAVTSALASPIPLFQSRTKNVKETKEVKKKPAIN